MSRPKKPERKRVPAHQAVERANQRLRALMRTVGTHFERDIAEDLVASDIDASRISCRVGCAHCCEMAIMASDREAQVIVLNHREIVEEVYDELLLREEAAQACGFTPAVTNIFDPETSSAREAFNDRWWGARISCAFLDSSSKRCRIYADRPLACRAYHVVDTPPALCEVRPPPGSQAIVQVFNPTRAYLRAMRTLFADHLKQSTLPSVGMLSSLVLDVFRRTK